MFRNITLPLCISLHRDGEVHIAGTQVTLFELLTRHTHGATPAELATEFPTVPAARIDEVIAFYLQNQAAVDDYLKAYPTRGTSRLTSDETR